jgi:hypothetical protein
MRPVLEQQLAQPAAERIAGIAGMCEALYSSDPQVLSAVKP